MTALPLFLSDWVPAAAFARDDLPLTVESDHAEVGVRVLFGNSEAKILSYNISNRFRHHWFGVEDDLPFRNTHLYTEDPNLEWLKQKETEQAKYIASRFNSGEVKAQVIVEGNPGFFRELSSHLCGGVECVSFLDTLPDQWDQEQHVTAILVDADYFDLTSRELLCSEVDGRPRCYPLVTVVDKVAGHPLAIVGAHVPGHASQYPKEALAGLADLVDNAMQRKGFPSDLLIMGDWNTPTDGVKRGFQSIMATRYRRPSIQLPPPYLTHVNPARLAAIYDNSVHVTSLTGAKLAIQSIGIDEVCDSSAALVSAIGRSCIRAT